jgi:hypothetical protein
VVERGVEVVEVVDGVEAWGLRVGTNGVIGCVRLVDDVEVEELVAAVVVIDDEPPPFDFKLVNGVIEEVVDVEVVADWADGLRMETYDGVVEAVVVVVVGGNNKREPLFPVCVVWGCCGVQVLR